MFLIAEKKPSPLFSSVIFWCLMLVHRVKNHPKKRFFLLNPKYFTTFATANPNRALQTYYKKAFIGACFGKQKTGNFLFTRNKRAVNAPWYVISVVSHNDQHIGVGIHCLFLLQGLSGTSTERISKKRFHAFLLY